MKLNPPPNPSVFPARQQVTAAMERAARGAHLLAKQTGTKLIVTAPQAKASSRVAHGTQ